MQILGLGHYSRTGKDTFAKYLKAIGAESGLRVELRAFAQKLKQICHDLYGWAGLREAAFYETPEGAPYRDQVLPSLGMTPVDIWVKAGMAMREVYPDTWIDCVLRAPPECDLLVITDVRFPNEAEAIRRAGGHLIKIERPGVVPRDTPADTALLGFRGWTATVVAENLAELEGWATYYAIAYASMAQAAC